MDSWSSNSIAESIQQKLKQIVAQCIEEYDGECDFKQKVHQKVSERMFGFGRSSSFEFGISSDFELKDSRFEVSQYTNGVRGKITFEYSERKNTSKYGKPGYRGNEDGEVCQYPDYSDSYYKWNNFFEKWEDVSDKICDDSIHSRSNGFMNNAAFGSIWGNNPSGGDTFSTNRHRNGGDLWGTPQIRKPLNGFNKISANIMKSIYEFTLNLKSAIDHYLKLEEAFKSDDIEVIEKMISKDSIYTVEEPMVKIQLEKVRNWSYFMNNGHVDQSGGLTRKDSIVYVNDSTKIQLMIEKRNLQIKQKAHDDFKKSNN